MEFCEFRSGWQALVAYAGKRALAEIGIHNEMDMISQMLDERTAIKDAIGFRHATFQEGWRRIGSPYYDVYPSIMEPLAKCSLEFPGNMVTFPSGLAHLWLRFPKTASHPFTFEIDGKVIRMRGLFISFQRVTRSVGSDKLEPGLVVGIDAGETADVDALPYPVFTLKVFPLDERPIEATVDSLSLHDSIKHGLKIDDATYLKCVRLAVATCMIQDDPSILEPQVLARDIGKTGDLRKMLERARKRGKFGFSLGKSVEVSPHIRRPHPALVWTGKGRKVPRIVFRKGSVIHRDVVEKVPTGKERFNVSDAG